MFKDELNIGKISSKISSESELFAYLIDEEKDYLFQEQTIFLRENSDEVPLSLAAQRLWFVNQLDPISSSQNNLSMALRAKGVLSVAALEQSINEILRRHEALRINISTVQGQPVQEILPSITLTLPIVDLQELPESKCENEAQDLLIKESQRFFDLNEGSLLRVMLIRLREEEHIILLTLHGIVSDYCSMGILLKEMVLLYEAFSTGTPFSLPQLPIQYADFAGWQRQRLQGEVLENQLVYWKQQLGGSLPVLQLPTDYPRPPVQTFRGARQSIVFSSTLSEALQALSSQEGVTLFTTLLSAFKVLLHRYTAQEDIWWVLLPQVAIAMKPRL
jgi:hypothetical protein